MSDRNKNIVLGDIAYARSGDKGNSANIGVIAYNDDGYHFLKSVAFHRAAYCACGLFN